MTKKATIVLVAFRILSDACLLLVLFGSQFVTAYGGQGYGLPVAGGCPKNRR